jgi:hypothetical protein
VEKYTDSLEDIHASHSVQQASDKEKKTQDTYGHTSSSTSGQLDLFGVFGKMSKDTPRWGYGESCPIWKKKVIDARSAYSARKKLALHTKGNECSSWGTPKEQDSRAASWDRGKSNLGEQVHGMAKSWATPQASDHIEGARTAKESNQKCLGRDLNQMQSWATPQGRDHLSAESKEKWEARAKLQAEKGVNLHLPLNTQCQHIMEDKHNGLQDQEKSNTSGKNHGSPKLSANWVEQLMGLSTGWTDLGSWGMELSPKQQN